jgi:hypothetical protein
MISVNVVEYDEGRNLGERGAEAADYSVLAQGDHGVEEGWGYGLADDGDAGGVDEEAGFYASGFGYGAASVVAGVVVPLGQGGQSVG